MKENLITNETLKKRGYFHFTKDTKVQQTSESEETSCIQKMKEVSNELLEIKEANPEDEELMDILDDCWVKCIPETSCEFPMFVVLCVKLLKDKDGWIYSDNHLLLKFDMNGAMMMGFYDYNLSNGSFYMNIPYNSNAEVEMEMLKKNRYVSDGFSFQGKPMPQNKEAFHPNPPYSLSLNSGWRYANWHMAIEVDKNDIILDIDFSTWYITSMFQRPRSCEDDDIERQDAFTYLCDQYTDEEWEKINSCV